MKATQRMAKNGEYLMKNSPFFTILGLCFIAVFTISVFARQEAEKEYREAKARGKLNRSPDKLPVPKNPGFRRRSTKKSRKKRKEERRLQMLWFKEQQELFEKFVAPLDEDRVKYRKFLDKANTGIVKLFPYIDCGGKKGILDVRNKCNSEGNDYRFRARGSAYSFRKETYGSSFSDIEFKESSLISNGFLANGFIVSLGDMKLDFVTLQMSELDYMTKFNPATNRVEARSQFQQFSNGVEIENRLFSNNLEVKANRTYVLRSIAYRYKDKFVNPLIKRRLRRPRQYMEEWSKFFSYGSDKRNDSIVAFRVIRKSDDGAITLIWKRLAKKKSPRLIYERREILKDFKK